jgi:DNA helicase-2/ATP-dependent DNA helicase PcrA
MSRTYRIPTVTARSSGIDYAAVLNEEQRRVVLAGGGPLLVIAGAGVGKTRTLTYRVARLIELGIPAARLMLVTFTNRAAREMLQRVEAIVPGDPRRVWGGTFHSIGNRLLRRHAGSLGYGTNYTILDTEDARELIDLAVEEEGGDRRAYRFPKGEVLREIFSLAINMGVPLPRMVAERYPRFEPLLEPIVQVEARYQRKKRERNVMDYDDLLVNWKRLLTEVPAVTALCQEQFQQILVDEYQDTNLLQAEILDLLARRHRQLTVVGDDAQSIYGWRGANFENLYLFQERYPEAMVFRLERNYRSTPEILALANASIERNVRQFPRQLQAVRPSRGLLPALVPARDVEQQATFVVTRLLELRDEGIPLREMAVLYRAHSHALELQLELTRRGVPYEVRSGVRFFEQAHIKDVTSVLRLLVNPRDELAWKRVLRMIPRVGPSTAEKLWSQLAADEEPLALVRSTTFAGSVPRRALEGWRDFSALLTELLAPETCGTPGRQISRILDPWYRAYLQTTYPNHEAREEEIQQLAAFASRYESTDRLLSELALVASERFAGGGGVGGEDVLQGGEEDERVTLSSIHQSKGLEWHTVFLLWVADGRFPAPRALWDPDGEEEERRLFYVAVTRAQEELHLCFPLLELDRTGQAILHRPSRFATEVPRSLFEIWNLEEAPPSFPEEDPSGPPLLH